MRLNGGGRSSNRQEPLPAELPVPVSTKARWAPLLAHPKILPVSAALCPDRQRAACMLLHCTALYCTTGFTRCCAFSICSTRATAARGACGASDLHVPDEAVGLVQEERARHMSELMMEVDALEGKLQEASKQRESRLRKVRDVLFVLPTRFSKTPDHCEGGRHQVVTRAD